MLLAEFTALEAGLLTVAAGVLPTLFFWAVFAWSRRMAAARLAKEAPDGITPIVSVKVEEVAPLDIVRTSVHAIAKHASPFATAHKLELHRGPHIAADVESPMPELKGTRNFVCHH